MTSYEQKNNHQCEEKETLDRCKKVGSSLLTELTATATKCKKTREAITTITQNLAEKVTLLTNESQKEYHL